MPIKQIVAIRRKPGMTQAEFSAYVRDVHGPIAAAKPLGVSRYVQNHAYDGAYGTATDDRYDGISHRDLVTELWFADAAAMERTFADPYAQTTIREDGKNFNDFPSATIALAEETTFTVPAPGDGAVKVFGYFKAAADAASALPSALQAAHVAVTRERPSLVAALRACIASVPLAGGANTAHFGGAAMPRYDAILMCRFADEATAGANFRPYHTALCEHLDGAIDASKSFFTFARETVVFDVAAPAVR